MSREVCSTASFSQDSLEIILLAMCVLSSYGKTRKTMKVEATCSPCKFREQSGGTEYL